MAAPRIVRRIRTWLSRMKPKALNELLAVELDEQGARVVVLDRLEPDWNQAFAWQDIKRVCFQDAGLYKSDMLFITVQGRDKPVVVLTEAKGGPALIGALAERGHFPEKVWRHALGDTSGGTHCWPPHVSDASQETPSKQLISLSHIAAPVFPSATFQRSNVPMRQCALSHKVFLQNELRARRTDYSANPGYR